MKNFFKLLKRQMQLLAGVDIAKIENSSTEKNKKKSAEEIIISEKQISQKEGKVQ